MTAESAEIEAPVPIIFGPASVTALLNNMDSAAASGRNNAQASANGPRLPTASPTLSPTTLLAAPPASSSTALSLITGTPPGMAADTGTVLPHLPAELWDMTFNYVDAAEDPRQILFNVKFPNILQHETPIWLAQPVKTPVLLHLCKRSREIALTRYDHLSPEATR